MSEEFFYHVDYVYKHIKLDGAEEEPPTYKASTSVTSQDKIEDGNADHFRDVSRAIFDAIPDCAEVQVLRIAEDSPMLREMREILVKSSIHEEDLFNDDNFRTD